MMRVYPDNLLVVPDGWVQQCHDEPENDIRHIGRYLIYEYICPKCGPFQYVTYDPDYSYCGPNSTYTCSHCASVMRLINVNPVIGKPKSVPLTEIRKST